MSDAATTRTELDLLSYEGLKVYHAKMQQLISDSAIIHGAVPAGCICLWSGSVSEIPTGWYLCDGQNGTPDLRHRFVIGHSSEIPVGSTGGSSNVTLSVSNIPAHKHSVSSVSFNDNGKGGSLFVSGEAEISTDGTGETGSTGGGEAFSILPPYYALAYIMRSKEASTPPDDFTGPITNDSIDNIINS